MPTVRCGTAEVSYQVTGAGKPIVLVHGTGASGAGTWAPMLRCLERGCTVVVPDLRGSGGTRDGGGELTLEELAADVLAVAADAGLEEFDLVGFSLGGAVAASIAASAPDKVRALVLIATLPSGGDSRARLQFAFWRDLFDRDRDLFARFWLLTGLSSEFVSAIPAEDLDRAAAFPLAPGLGRQSTLNMHVDLMPILASIETRTLVVGCTHDVVVPAPRAREVAAAIRGAEYVELDSGHMVVLEAPARLVGVIDGFLTRVPSGT